jgi:hypothetical protein
MKQKIVERRTVLKGGAAAIGMLGSGASASMVAGVEQASADTTLSSVPDQILTAFSVFGKPFQPTSITSTSRRSSDRFS